MNGMLRMAEGFTALFLTLGCVDQRATLNSITGIYNDPHRTFTKLRLIISAGLSRGLLALKWIRLVLLYCSLPVLVACTGFDEVEFHPATSGEYSPRSEPAQVTQATSEELQNEGYIYLGWLNVRHQPGKSYPTDTATRSRAEAAARGGDLVQLSLNNVETLEVRYRTVCEDWITIHLPRQICGVGEGYACQSRRLCTLFTKVPVPVDVVKSTALLWRRSP